MRETNTDEDRDKQNEKIVDNYIRTAAKISIISEVDKQIEENITKRNKDRSKEDKE